MDDPSKCLRPNAVVPFVDASYQGWLESLEGWMEMNILGLATMNFEAFANGNLLCCFHDDQSLH